MINLYRAKNHRWIFQKNISDVKQILEFLDAAKTYGDYAKPDLMLSELKKRGVYKGRSSEGSSNTFGVRRSEMKFYMFGYSYPESPKSTFYQTSMTKSIFEDDSKENIARMSLVNLFSMQFPHPFSNTPSCFKIHIGRLLLKLLTDERLENKLYIDEFCYFLPFLECVDSDIYHNLVDSILEFRRLNFYEKDALFKQVDDYNDVFSNVFHECNYYFLRIFNSLGVLQVIGDSRYNDGNLHKFIHGNNSAIRNDAFQKNAKYSGYFRINPVLLDDAIDLLELYSPFDPVVTEADEAIRSKEDFINELYVNRPLSYLAVLDTYFEHEEEVNNIISGMVRESRYGSRDGRSFEEALKSLFKLFEQAENVELIGGSGNTDLLITMRDKDELFKINVDAKTSIRSTNQLNPARLSEHLAHHGSKYCIVVSSRFASGVSNDIRNTNIVAVDSETLANYCYCLYNPRQSEFIDFSLINELIINNLGTNISKILQRHIDMLYQLA